MKRLRKKPEPPAPVEYPAYAWRDYFFQLTRNPVSVSNLLVALAAGTVVQVERCPPELLPALVLLATAGLRRFNQQIVDDYAELLSRTETSLKESDIACRLPSGERLQHINMFAVNEILLQGPSGEYCLDRVPETRYVESLYQDMVSTEVEQLFDKEIAICK